jgi:hypothetical protein
MDDSENDRGLNSAFDRADQALRRIEQALGNRQANPAGSDADLRARVREVVDELDQLIREAAA